MEAAGPHPGPPFLHASMGFSTYLRRGTRSPRTSSLLCLLFAAGLTSQDGISDAGPFCENSGLQQLCGTTIRWRLGGPVDTAACSTLRGVGRKTVYGHLCLERHLGQPARGQRPSWCLPRRSCRSIVPVRFVRTWARNNCRPLPPAASGTATLAPWTRPVSSTPSSVRNSHPTPSGTASRTPTGVRRAIRS